MRHAFALASLLMFACGDSTPGGQAGAGGLGGMAGGGAAGTGGAGTGGGGSGAAGGAGAAGAGGAAGAAGVPGGAGAGGAGAGGAGSGAGAGGAGAGGAGAGGAGMGACGETPTFADGLTPSREVHVSAAGSDDGDGSTANPFRTLRRATMGIMPGTAVRMRAGTYPGDTYLSDLSGTATAPIWIGGVPGEALPVIEGGSQALHLSRVRYLVISDLEVRNQTANGINCDDGGDYANEDATRYVVFRNLFLHDVGSGGNQDCLKLSGVNDYAVLDSRFDRCGSGSGEGSAVDHVGCHRGVIARNEFSNLSANAVQCKGGSADIEIRQNRMIDAGQRAVNIGGSTGLEFFRPPLMMGAENSEARNIRVIANLIVRGDTPFAFVGCVDCLAAANTVVDPARFLLRILQETASQGGYTFAPARDGRVIDNIFYYARASLSDPINIGPGTDAPTFVFSHNLWYAQDRTTDVPPLPSAEVEQVIGMDPQLGADYAIGANSPAAGRGIAVQGVRADVTGRCYLDPPSIGAFEVR